MCDEVTRQPLLLVRPRPVEGEASPEYLQRICHENILGGVLDLMRLLDRTFGELVQTPPLVLHRILSSLVPVSKIPKATLDHFAGTLHNRMGVSHFARTCPYCLRESNKLNGEWCLPLSISCETHQRLLIDRCPDCLKPIRRTESQYSCTCGCQFHLIETNTSPSWMELFYAVFAPWRTAEDYRQTDSSTMAYEMSAVKFLRRVTPAQTEDDSAAISNIQYERAHWLNSRDVGPLGSLMAKWPNSVVEAIAEAIDDGIRNTAPWAAVKRNASDALAKCLSDAEEVVRVRIAAMTQASITSRARAADSVSNIARALAVNMLTAKHLKQDADWKAAVFNATGQSPDGSLIGAIRALVATTERLEEAAESLGASRKLLCLLFALGHLPHIRCGRAFRNIRFLKSELEGTVQRLQTIATNSTGNSPGLVCLVAIPIPLSIKRVGAIPKDWAQFLSDLFSGRAQLVCLSDAPKTLADFALHAKYVADALSLRIETLPLLSTDSSNTVLV